MFHWFKCYSPIKCFILKNSTSPRVIIQQPGTFAMPSKYCFGSSWPNRNGHLNHGKAMAFDTQQKNPWHHGALSYHSQTHHIVGSITSYNVASVKHIPPSSKARFGVTDFETSRLRPFFLSRRVMCLVVAQIKIQGQAFRLIGLAHDVLRDVDSWRSRGRMGRKWWDSVIFNGVLMGF